MESFKSLKKICILGCGGFIGSHLVERLLSKGGYSIIGLDITSEKIKSFVNAKNFSFHSVNIFDTEKVYKWIKECDTVISLVALCNPSLYNTIPLDVIESNFTKPLNTVKACLELKKRIIHFSTSEVYGKTQQALLKEKIKPDNNNAYILNEDHSPMILGSIHAQRWTYACAKQLLERTIYAYGFEKGLHYTIVRPFNFIGPRMDYLPGIDREGVPRVLACFMSALLQNKPLQLVNGGKNRRCFTYIDDAIDALIRILDHPEVCDKQILNIGNPGNEVTIAELASLMIELYRELAPTESKNHPQTQIISSQDFYGSGYEDSDRRVPDNTKIEQLINWKPFTGLKDALRKTITSYIKGYSTIKEACRGKKK